MESYSIYFCVWLLSFGVMSMIFIHIVACTVFPENKTNSRTISSNVQKLIVK